MQYKTIVLALLQNRPQLYEELRSQRQLLAMLDHYSHQLMTRHESWKECLSQQYPENDPLWIASAAGELALQELVDSLPPALPGNDNDPTPTMASPRG